MLPNWNFRQACKKKRKKETGKSDAQQKWRNPQVENARDSRVNTAEMERPTSQEC